MSQGPTRLEPAFASRWTEGRLADGAGMERPRLRWNLRDPWIRSLAPRRDRPTDNRELDPLSAPIRGPRCLSSVRFDRLKTTAIQSKISESSLAGRRPALESLGKFAVQRRASGEQAVREGKREGASRRSREDTSSGTRFDLSSFASLIRRHSCALATVTHLTRPVVKLDETRAAPNRSGAATRHAVSSVV